MIRIIHLSDLHVRSDNWREENKNAQALVKEIIDRYKGPQAGKTIVVMTGDLVDDGKLAQYKNLKRTVIDPLRGEFTLLAVPGNHDYALKGNFFDKYAPPRFDKYVHPLPQYPLPSVDALDLANEKKVVFIGIDSADRKNKASFANGIVDGQQIEQLEATMTQYADRFKIIYVHHHPFLRDLFASFQNADAFLESVRKNVDLVLFGHKHKHEVFFGRYGIQTMLASGKVTGPEGDALLFRVVELEKTGRPVVLTEEIPAV